MGVILGIESSCDDTAAAVIDSNGQVLSSVVSSQNDIHARYGGVVPELASRQHLTNLPVTVKAALEEAGTSWRGLSGLAVTAGPGLLGSLLVGVSFAKAAASALKLPVQAVNHIQAHLSSPWMEHPDLPYPALTLVVSGGHSHLFLARSPGSVSLVAATRDDAAGEALDKLAKRLHLPYPGGPAIDRLADRGNSRAVPFSLPRMSSDSLDYSFSGLKTAALHFMKRNDLEPEERPNLELLPQWEYDLIASFQKRVVDHLLQRIRKAALSLRPKSLTMAGGVACNRLLRERLSELGDDLKIRTAYPRPSYCTDNAAMVAFVAHLKTRTGDAPTPLVDAFPSCRWEPLTLC